MTEYPVITNKYTAKAVYSGNIVNGLYEYEVYPTASEICKAKFTADGNTSVEFEKPFETTTPAGNTISVDKSCTVYGFDYLGQPLKEVFTLGTSDTSKVSTIVCWKYISKVEIASASDTTITIKNDCTNLGLPFKSIKSLSTTKITTTSTASTTLNVTAPVMSVNGGASCNTRGYLTVASANMDATYKNIIVADNSTFMLNGEEVGGLYGQPINL